MDTLPQTATGLPTRPAPHRLTVHTTRALWVLVVASTVVTAALTVVVTYPDSCRGRACDVATIGGHPMLTLVLVVCGVAALLVLAPLTDGFREASAGLRVAVAAAGAWTGIFTAGALLVLTTVGLLAALALVVALAFASHSREQC